MELSRFGIKLLATDPAAMQEKNFVPIFHSWIQKQAVEKHQLIDVHDYSHIHHGPGILLVAHEGNFSTEMGEGIPGLVYFRKLPAGPAGTFEETLRASLKAVLQAAALIEAEPSLEGRVRFRRDEFIFISNDRLIAPNNAASVEAVTPVLRKVFGEKATLTPVRVATRDRLTIRVTGVAY
jgi:hypothetical protein